MEIIDKLKGNKMKKILEKINVEIVMAVIFFITAMVIFLTNGNVYTLEYALNVILGFVFVGFDTIRNDIKDIKQN